MKYFFTADEHYGHANIIKYCNRPFPDPAIMDNEIIKRHNEVVGEHDTTFHLGDFTFYKDLNKVRNIIRRLNGNHVFLRGNHDYWMDEINAANEFDNYDSIEEIELEGEYIVMCHYNMRVWNRSHHGSWQLFGHSHGKLEGVGKQIDVGVDTHNFYPYSFEEVKQIMKTRGNNFNQLSVVKPKGRSNLLENTLN